MVRRLTSILCALASLLASGCARDAGIIFPAMPSPIVWPGGDDPARIRYVGQLATSDDLKPGRSSLEGIGQAIFGKPANHGMITPFAVCTDGGSLVFVADSGARLVHVFDLLTRRYAQWAPSEKQPQLALPIGIAWDASGRLLVSDSAAGAIFVFDTEGKYVGQLGKGQLKRPCGIAIHPATRHILVADSTAHQVVVFSPDGKEVSRIGGRGMRPGEFNFPVDVVTDHHGRIYVADAMNFRVQQISSDLKTFQIIGGKGDMPGYFSQPKCLDVDSEDHLYVVDNRFEAAQIFDSQGRLLLNFGSEGHGPGQFWLPTGIFIDPNNRIWIADSYNHRVQVFDYLPQASPPPTTQPEARP